jgi:hypothetical protein
MASRGRDMNYYRKGSFDFSDDDWDDTRTDRYFAMKGSHDDVEWGGREYPRPGDHVPLMASLEVSGVRGSKEFPAHESFDPSIPGVRKAFPLDGNQYRMLDHVPGNPGYIGWAGASAVGAVPALTNLIALATERNRRAGLGPPIVDEDLTTDGAAFSRRMQNVHGDMVTADSRNPNMEPFSSDGVRSDLVGRQRAGAMWYGATMRGNKVPQQDVDIAARQVTEGRRQARLLRRPPAQPPQPEQLRLF